MRPLLSLLLLLTAAAGITAAEIRFLQGTYADAMARAKAEGKPVMIDFVTDWCRWCDTLDVRTYSDPKVAEYVNARVVPIKIDAEKGEGIEIAKRYGVQAYPTILFVDVGGAEIDRLLGFLPPEPFLKGVDDYLNGRNTVASLRAAADAAPGDAAAQLALARRHAERYDYAPMAGSYRKVLELDPSDALGAREEADFQLAMASYRMEKNLQGLAAFAEAYPKSEHTRGAVSTLTRAYLKGKDGASAQKVFDRYIASFPDDHRMMNAYAWTCGETKLNLEQAAAAAATAVTIAPGKNEKAMYLDTQAAVAFARGNVDEAIGLERSALELLKDAPPAERKAYEEALTKYSGAKQKPAGG
jgi:thioredoxin-related protein